MKESIKEKLAEPIQSFRLPRYRELPDVGLYLEQVVRYVNRYMILNGNELTPSMVSNYVKQKLIPGPVKKSYGADAIAYLLFLSYTKMVVPLGDIHFMIDIQKDSYGLAVAYDAVAPKSTHANLDSIVATVQRRGSIYREGRAPEDA